MRSHILLPELPPFSFPDGFRESIGIAVQEPAAKRVKAGEAAVKLNMPPHTPSQQVQIHQQMTSTEEKQTSAVQDAFDGGGSAGGGSTGGSAADQLETNPVMPEEKKAPEVQEPPHQWNQDGDIWRVEEVSSGRANRNSLSSPESTCTTVVPKKADAQGNGEQEYDTAAGSPTKSISSADEGSSVDDAEDDMQGSPSHPCDSSAGEEPTFVPCWSRTSSLDVEDIAVPQEPTLMWYKSPEDFGMGSSCAEFLGMSERALWHSLPIVRVKFGFGEHEPAEQAEYLQLVENFRNTMLAQELQDSEINS